MKENAQNTVENFLEEQQAASYLRNEDFSKSYSRKRSTTQELVLCSLFAALIAAGAFIRIPVPAVPFTLQFLFANLAGLLLGRKNGFLAVAVYIALGLAGLPVFTAGGGIAYLLQPTFGYILGFAAGAYLAGWMVERAKEKSVKIFFWAGMANLGIVYLFGLIYYYIIARFYLGKALGVGTLLLYGFVLAVPGDMALCVASALLAKRLWKTKSIIKGGQHGPRVKE